MTPGQESYSGIVLSALFIYALLLGPWVIHRTYLALRRRADRACTRHVNRALIGRSVMAPRRLEGPRQ